MEGGRAAIEEEVSRALRPGRYISPYKEVSRLIRRLEGIRERIGGILDRGEADEAVRLFWSFLVRVFQKIPEVDPSGGNFSLFFESLFCDWVRAQQEAGADPGETARIYMEWAEQDEWGYLMDLHERLVQVLDSAGIQAFLRLVRERAEALGPEAETRESGYSRDHWVEVMKALMKAQGNVTGFFGLCGREGMSPADFDSLAGMQEKQGLLEEALAWVEKGLDSLRGGRMDPWVSCNLQRRKGEILVRLGRLREALEFEWGLFQEDPCRTSFNRVLSLVPSGEREVWREKALAWAEGADLVQGVEIFLSQKDLERLAGRLEREDLTFLAREFPPLARRTAKALARAHPLVSARIFRELALSKLERAGGGYKRALRDFERARDGFLAAGRRAEWRALVFLVRRRHGRKTSFLPGFEALVSGMEETGE